MDSTEHGWTERHAAVATRALMHATLATVVRAVRDCRGRATEQEVRSVVGRVLASGLARQRNGRLVPTRLLVETAHQDRAEALRLQDLADSGETVVMPWGEEVTGPLDEDQMGWALTPFTLERVDAQDGRWDLGDHEWRRISYLGKWVWIRETGLVVLVVPLVLLAVIVSLPLVAIGLVVWALYSGIATLVRR